MLLPKVKHFKTGCLGDRQAACYTQTNHYEIIIVNQSVVKTNEEKTFRPHDVQSLEFDYLVFIGRFEPYHMGHQAVISTALAKSRHVIVLIGSAFMPRSTRNPFTVDERKSMILKDFSSEETKRIHCVGLEDHLYNDTRWVQAVQHAVNQVTQPEQADKALNIGLIGHRKDRSSYYLSLFPHWASVPVENYHNISATPMRESYLLGAMPQPDKVPASTIEFLQHFKNSSAYAALQQEAWYIDEYKRQWQSSPYPPTFVTTDAIMVCAGHILLIERKSLPGKGLWALPGGFIDENETLFESCVRELREETGLTVSDADLRHAFKAQRTFDDPHRSARGRTITQAFYFDLGVGRGLPLVEGADDAAHAFWVALADVQPMRLFEDHYAMITEMVGL